MPALEIGVALNTVLSLSDSTTLDWADLRDLALRCETIGFDTVWFPDGLIWLLTPGGPIVGGWDPIAVLAGLAASTSRIRIGSWVLASLFRDPGMVAKQAATIDAISGGRFVLGLGAGEAGIAAHAFGFPSDHVYERFEDALQIVIPLLRTGRADFEGRYWLARDLPQVPAGPRPGRIPILLAAHGPRGYRHAARQADVWSCFQQTTGDTAELAPRIEALEAACIEVGRDPATIGRSAGIVVAPLAGPHAEVSTPYGRATSGPAGRIADALRALRDAGYSRVELMVEPLTPAAVDALAPVVTMLRNDGPG